MSIREHDHWHVIRLDWYPKDWYRKIALGEQRTMPDSTFAAQGTPFDMLTLRGRSIEQLAQDTATIVNRLELDNHVILQLLFRRMVAMCCFLLF